MVTLISNTAQGHAGSARSHRGSQRIPQHKALDLGESPFSPISSLSIIPKLYSVSSLLYFLIINSTGEAFWDQKDPRNLAGRTKAHQLTAPNRRSLIPPSISLMAGENVSTGVPEFAYKPGTGRAVAGRGQAPPPLRMLTWR